MKFCNFYVISLTKITKKLIQKPFCQRTRTAFRFEKKMDFRFSIDISILNPKYFKYSTKFNSCFGVYWWPAASRLISFVKKVGEQHR